MGEIGEFWRDVKEHKKRKIEEDPPRRRCWDWMVVSGTCHFAKNRSSFKDYRQVGKDVPNAMFTDAPPLYVAGVGTVELKVRASAKKGASTRTLILEDVLHVPSAMCNGFNVMAYHRENGGTSGMKDGTDEHGDPLWCSQEFKGLSRLVLAGNPQGESYLNDGPKMLSLYVDLEDIFGDDDMST